MNYLSIDSLSKDKYDELTQNGAVFRNTQPTPESDLRRIENILDLKPNILEGRIFNVEEGKCECGRTITMFDIIFSALVEQIHPPSSLVHIIFGKKLIVKQHHPVRCSDCGNRITKGNGSLEPAWFNYEADGYGCCMIEN